MIALTYIPRPPLSDFVEMFWLYEGYSQPHARERLLPTGTIELVIDLREDAGSTEHAVVCGAHSEFFVLDTSRQAAVLGVHFRPGGAFPFLNLPAGELHNQHVTLDTLWGRKAGQLRERVLEARTPAARFRILEESLLALANGCLERHPAVGFALKQFQVVPGGRSIADVTDEIGLSPRRFSQVFEEEVGLTPKLYCRVRRFQQVLRVIHQGQPFEWANLALACGYYDQAHFIHDFRAFSGISPTAYLRDKTEHLNHVPLVD
jgi:AraC-like DNA-binding protein